MPITDVIAAPYSSTAGHIDRPVAGSGDIVEGEHVFTLGSCSGAVHFGRLDKKKFKSAADSFFDLK